MSLLSVRLDPERNEPAALFDLAGSLSGQSVLEIGCGDARLTWLYADQAGSVLGIDPKPEDIARAVKNCPPHLRERVEFRTGSLEEFVSPDKFDLALLAWSL